MSRSWSAVRASPRAPRRGLVSQVDLMPTTLAVAGLDPDAGRALDGRSMLANLRSGRLEQVAQAAAHRAPLKNWAHLHEGETVLIDHYAAGEQEVYDMAADPHQISSRHATTDTTAMTARLTTLRNARGQALRALEV